VGVVGDQLLALLAVQKISPLAFLNPDFLSAGSGRLWFMPNPRLPPYGSGSVLPWWPTMDQMDNDLCKPILGNN